MRFFRVSPRRFAVLCSLAVWLGFAATPAWASGTIVIRHQNGKVNTYDKVAIKIIHSALYLTTQDGKGTIVIHRAACSYQGKLLVCLPTSATLVQSGSAGPIDLRTGTVYLNDTDDPQPLVLSTTKVPPHSVMLALTTNRGTSIGLNGRIDSVVK